MFTPVAVQAVSLAIAITILDPFQAEEVRPVSERESNAVWSGGWASGGVSMDYLVWSEDGGGFSHWPIISR
jgi:hypothetical protein